MGRRRLARYGEWASPISARLVGMSSKSYDWVQAFDDDVWWSQTRPEEAGRCVVVSRSAGDLLPAPWSARSGVHEYGGLSWAGVEYGGDRCLLFIESSDQRVYLLRPLAAPVALTPPSNGNVRFAEPVVVGSDVYLVQETHEGGRVSRALVSLDVNTSRLTERHTGFDFYSNLTPSPDGHHIAWLGWQHPQMPWDGTQLSVGRVVDDGLVDVRVVAGSADESVTDIVWKDPGSLYFISDATGWWNLWEANLEGGVQPLIADGSDWGAPKWQVGTRSLFGLPDGRLLVFRTKRDRQVPAIVDLARTTITDVPSTFNAWHPTGSSHGFHAYGVAEGPASQSAVIRLNLEELPSADVVSQVDLPVTGAYFTKPRAILIPSEGRDIHAVIHHEHHPGFAGPGDERPPLLINVHGGPTGRAMPVLDLRFAYFTSRGFSVVDVNHTGSSGYGRAYREGLRGRWGVADVEDVVAVARSLVADGHADANRILISGGSAGGFTALNALIHSDVFAAGASYYGLADLESMQLDTHDFESHYLESLVGPYPASRATFVDRSPLTHAGMIGSPLIIFQGLDDAVVPASQAEALRDACLANGVLHEYHAFAGEGHGFTRADTIAACLERELAFYGKVLGFVPKY